MTSCGAIAVKRSLACVHGASGGRLAPLARAVAPLSLVVAAGTWLAATPGSVADRLATVLESSFERPEIGDGRDFAGVIALGGSEDRIREAGRLARQFPHLRVVVSGSGEANLVRRLLGPGIEPDRVVVESRARTTHENALFSAAIVRQMAGERWLLVTSAAHMPRAIGAFRRRQLSVAAWPVYDRRPGEARAYAVARHEWLGLLAYWLLGRTSALMPGPMEAALIPTKIATMGSADPAAGSTGQTPVTAID